MEVFLELRQEVFSGSMSAVKRLLQVCMVTALSAVMPFSAMGRVVVVRATRSIPVEAERQYASRLTDRLSEWLNEAGAEHRVINDEDLEGSGLKGVSVAILGYNPFPSRAALGKIKDFLGNGGKLIVFYSSEPRLARMMNMRLGKYQAQTEPGQWKTIRFNEKAPANLPQTVIQDSRNIRPCLPSGGSEVIAWWYNSQGEKTGDPAVVMSPHGFWMTHVLLNDGDTRNKQRFLTGMIAHLDPSSRPGLTRAAIQEAVGLGKYDEYSQTVAAISSAAAGSRRRAEVMAQLEKADALYKRLDSLAAAGGNDSADNAAHELSATLATAYAMCFNPKTGEFRGIWDHSPEGLYPGNWDRTCSILAAAGFTDVFPNMAWGALAHYESRVVPRSDTWNLMGDQLEQCVKAAHKHGLKVHAWKVCWNLNSRKDSFTENLRAQGRLMVSDKGKTIDWLCPSHPANRKLEVDIATEMAGKYDIDGYHLDYIRYYNSNYCFCDGCRTRFEEAIGRKIASWPEEVIQGKLNAEFSRWRRDQITTAVREISKSVKSVRPKTKVSAAVYGSYPSCITSIGQDWGLWLRKGYLDFACPMNYTEISSQFNRLLELQSSLPGAGTSIIPGIGVTSSQSTLGPVQTIDQISALRKAGFPGFVLFELNTTVEKEILPTLSEGVTFGTRP